MKTVLCLCLLSISNVSAKGLVFKRNDAIRDVITSESLLGELYGIMKEDCTTLCLMNYDCVSFFWNEIDKTCRLHGMDFQTNHGMNFSTGFSHFHLPTDLPQKRSLPRTCVDIAACSSGDGEYFMYPLQDAPSQAVALYCHNTTYDPQEFLSLHYYNYVQRKKAAEGCSGPVVMERSFEKIRLNVSTMEVVRNDYSHSTSTNLNQKYGMANDCSATKFYTCNRATMTIDLRGTGFVVSPDTQWTSKGWYQEQKEYERTHNDAKIYVKCAGHCGTCNPTDEIIKLVHSPEQHVLSQNIKTVVCN